MKRPSGFFLRIAIALATFAVVLSCHPDGETMPVLSVHDGDSLRLRRANGEDMAVRLYGVDCPELGQPLWREAAPKENGPALRQQGGPNVSAMCVDFSSSPYLSANPTTSPPKREVYQTRSTGGLLFLPLIRPDGKMYPDAESRARTALLYPVMRQRKPKKSASAAKPADAMPKPMTSSFTPASSCRSSQRSTGRVVYGAWAREQARAWGLRQAVMVHREILGISEKFREIPGQVHDSARKGREFRPGLCR